MLSLAFNVVTNVKNVKNDEQCAIWQIMPNPMGKPQSNNKLGNSASKTWELCGCAWS